VQPTPPTPDPLPPFPPLVGSFGRFAGVSCGSPTACLAVGKVEQYSPGWAAFLYAGALVERWDGRRWSIQPTAEMTPTGVSCPSPTACTVIGTSVRPNRRAGELLAQGIPAADITPRVGQTVESLETVPLLAKAITDAGINAPVTTALARLIEDDLPLDDWVAVVRTTVPPPARWRPQVRSGFWKRVRERIRYWFTRRPPVDQLAEAEPQASATQAETVEMSRNKQQSARQADDRS
jgi:hypothetical protein